jgi:hypothetical protein
MYFITGRLNVTREVVPVKVATPRSLESSPELDDFPETPTAQHYGKYADLIFGGSDDEL